MTPSAVRIARPLTGRHVLIGVVGFFAVVVGLDSLFTVWAVQTFPGEVSPHAYEDGLAYNRAIAARRTQARLGWRARVTQAGRPGAIVAAFEDAAGRPLEGLAVKAAFTRPATEAGARVITLKPDAAGAYAGTAALGGGAWDLTLTATDRQGRRFEAQRRLVWR
ncbi:MAG: FixH family protein [Caulobacteraceae bacterium]|nr:FixH family protein [Caulobacteraceae bacterium]